MMKFLTRALCIFLLFCIAVSSANQNSRLPSPVSKLSTNFERSDSSLPSYRKFQPEDEISEKPWSPLLRFLKDIDFPTRCDFGL